MDAIVVAGGQPKPGELLYEETHGEPKALLDIAGKPMAQWVLDALGGSASIENILIVGLSPDCGLSSPKPLSYLQDQDNMVDNIRTGTKKLLEINPKTNHLLLVTSDIPGIQPEMVDWTIQTAMQTDEDIYYNVITRQVMEAKFPNSRRSYVKLRDGEFCGGDMNVIRASIVFTRENLWERIIAARKNAAKQAAIIGFDVLLLMLLRLIDVDGATRRVAKRLGLTGRPLICPYAEIGMDVDKPFQLEIMRAFLSHNRVP